jgi:alanyl-tRNA synthetase
LPLPAPSVDTGAELERIAGVLQGVPSNFDTDLFIPIIERAVEVVGKKYDRGPSGASYRVLADHARAVAFLLADGVYPSNEGRGYVVRRILRRAVRHAWLLGRREPTLVHLVRTVEGVMGSAYPDLIAKRATIEKAIHGEEERFFDTIEGGLTRLDDLKGAQVISGEEAFKLYDTFGFPIDLTEIIATERGQTVDLEGFERALEGQRDRSRSAEKQGEPGVPAVHTKRGGEWRTVKPKGTQRWVGYDTTTAETDVLKFRQADDRVEVVLEQNPFYLESGGQVSDTGRVTGKGWTLDVEGVEKVDGVSAVVGHFEQEFEPTPCLRRWTSCGARTSSATTRRRIWHAALRRVLGPHVRQQGSVVARPAAIRLRASRADRRRDAGAHRRRGEHARLGESPVETREMKYPEALAAGATAFFTEKYGDIVRVVDIPGVSLELCGGITCRRRPHCAVPLHPPDWGRGRRAPDRSGDWAGRLRAGSQTRRAAGPSGRGAQDAAGAPGATHRTAARGEPQAREAGDRAAQRGKREE